MLCCWIGFYCVYTMQQRLFVVVNEGCQLRFNILAQFSSSCCWIGFYCVYIMQQRLFVNDSHVVTLSILVFALTKGIFRAHPRPSSGLNAANTQWVPHWRRHRAPPPTGPMHFSSSACCRPTKGLSVRLVTVGQSSNAVDRESFVLGSKVHWLAGSGTTWSVSARLSWIRDGSV